ncbi:MAG: RimK family alpha-L-glutamate ligase [Rikenellaceae bacterium]
MKTNFKGWAIYPSPQTQQQRENNAFSMMQEAALKNGIEIKVLFLEDLAISVSKNKLGLLYKGKEIEKPLFAIMRCYETHLSQHLEMMGVRLFNSHNSMCTSQDKFTTHQRLALLNIPTPKTYWGITSYKEACTILGSTSFIMKLPVGSKGEAVYLVDNEDEFNTHPNSLVQEYISESRGRDIRVWVVGDIAIAAVERMNDASFLSNYAQGGSAKKINLTSSISDLAIKGCQALGLEFAGVDILYLKDGTYTICEINGNAGFRTLWLTNQEINLLDELFKYIRGSFLEKI